MILLIVALNKECIIKECKRIRRKPQNNRVPNARVGEAGLGLLPQQVPGQQPGSQLIQQPVGPPRAPQAAQPAARMTTELHPADGDQTTGHGGKRQADSVPTGGGGDNEQTKAMTVYEPSNDQNRSWNGVYSCTKLFLFCSRIVSIPIRKYLLKERINLNRSKVFRNYINFFGSWTGTVLCS